MYSFIKFLLLTFSKNVHLNKDNTIYIFNLIFNNLKKVLYRVSIIIRALYYIFFLTVKN